MAVRGVRRTRKRIQSPSLFVFLSSLGQNVLYTEITLPGLGHILAIRHSRSLHPNETTRLLSTTGKDIHWPKSPHALAGTRVLVHLFILRSSLILAAPGFRSCIPFLNGELCFPFLFVLLHIWKKYVIRMGVTRGRVSLQRKAITLPWTMKKNRSGCFATHINLMFHLKINMTSIYTHKIDASLFTK